MELLDALPDASSKGVHRPVARPLLSARGALLADLCGGAVAVGDCNFVGMLPQGEGKRKLKGFEALPRACAAKCVLMRTAKRAKRVEKAKQELEIAQQPVSDAWNLQRLRFGDRLSCGVANVHPQQFPIASVLRSAWGQIHAKAVAYEGLDGTRRQLEIASVVAAAMPTLQTRFVNSTVEQICRSKACAIIFKYYDATPRDISFGELRGQMAPHARYPVLQEDGKWKCLSLDELRQVKGSRLAVHRGVVDLLASSMECYWTDNVDKVQPDTWTMHGLRVLVPPVFLQRGNASCLYEATEKSVPAFSSEGILQFCAHCPFVIRCEVPDFFAAAMGGKCASRLQTLRTSSMSLLFKLAVVRIRFSESCPKWEKVCGRRACNHCRGHPGSSSTAVVECVSRNSC